MDQLKARKILGVGKESTGEEIREAYRKLTSQIHPEEDPAGFAEIQQAYRALTRSQNAAAASLRERPDAFPPAEEDHDQAEDIDAQFEEEFFRLISEEADAQDAQNKQRENELDELRSVISFKGRVSSPERLQYLLEKYPLSYAQYTQLQKQIFNQDHNVFRRDSSYDDLITLIREKRGIIPMRRKTFLILCACTVLLWILMESLSRGTGALTCIMLLVSVMIYKELRTILHPSISLLLLSLMLFTTGITTILQEGDVCENTGFLLFIASLAMMVYAAVRMCIFAVKSSLHRKETSI